MQRASVSIGALAAGALLSGCGTTVTVLSSGDAGQPNEGGAADAEAGPDPGLDGGKGMLGDEAEASTDDSSDEGVGSTCDVCSGGMTCQSGQCACPSGLALCDGTCVDEQADNGNCGGCGAVCSANVPSTAACTAGRCVTTLHIGGYAAGALVLDTTSAYLTEGNPVGGDLIKVSTLDGTETVLASGNAPTGIAVDATGVYWTENVSPGDVMLLSTGSAAPTTLASGQDLPSPIAMDATSVYWMNIGDYTNSDGSFSLDSASVMKVSKSSGGSPITLTSAPNIELFPGFAVDATSVYWTTTDGVMKVSTGGGTANVLASAQNMSSLGSLAVDATSVYWTTTNAIMKVSTGGGTVTTLASVPGVTPSQIAVDGSNVYWTYSSTDATSNGGVMKLSTEGGTPTILTSLPFSPGYLPEHFIQGPLAVDATSVYVTIQESSAPSTSPGSYSLIKVTPK